MEVRIYNMYVCDDIYYTATKRNLIDVSLYVLMYRTYVICCDVVWFDVMWCNAKICNGIYSDSLWKVVCEGIYVCMHCKYVCDDMQHIDMDGLYCDVRVYVCLRVRARVWVDVCTLECAYARERWSFAYRKRPPGSDT